MRAAAVLLVAGFSLACSPGATGTGTQFPAAGAVTTAGAQFQAFLEAEWEHELREWPTWASTLGDHRYDDRWPDVSPAGYASRAAYSRDLQRRVHAVDAAALAADDRLSLELLTRDVDAAVEGEPFRLWHLAVTQLDGVQQLDQVADQLRFTTVADYDAWIARLRGLGGYVDGTIATLREGAREHIVHPRVEMERLPAQIARQVVSDPAQSPFFHPFKRFPAGIPDSERARLVGQAKDAIAAVVVPAYRRLADFFTAEYLPACSPAIGIWQLPRGDEAYGYLVRLRTTSTRTPSEIHDIGLREVARIRGEMVELLARLGTKGTLPELFAWLRTDAQFFYPDSASLLEAYAAMTKRIEPRLVTQFRVLPRTPYGVEPVPDEAAADSTAAYYVGPAGDGSRAGTLFVNVAEPKARPRWEMMALVLHEGVPGHHLQIALAAEQQNLPKFRRHADYTAYVEGWALYAESLGDDMGLYDDPYAKLGQLSMEMWRAVRLVLDTGIHSMHWDRQKALDYALANAPKSETDMRNEVDRFAVWPAQALAYKIGQLEIQKLRDEARAKLGARFDVKAFHDAVLRDGALPLDVLDRRVEAWIDGTSP